MGLNYKISEKQDELFVNLTGDLDAYSSDDFKTEVLESLTTPRNVLIDATKLEFIDSTGLGSLMSIYNKVNEDSHKISIVNIKPNVKKIFEITNLDKLFNIGE